MDLWVRQGLAVLDHFTGGKRCGLVGHSLGGALALKIASHAPQVTKILTSSSIGASYPLNDTLDAFWTLPRDPDELRRIMGDMVFDQSAITDEMLEQRWEPPQPAGLWRLFRRDVRRRSPGADRCGRGER